MPAALDPFDRLPLAVRCAVDSACTAFEDALRNGERPDLGRALAGFDGAGRAVLLVELIGLEVEYRRRAGEPAGLAEYLARFPDDRSAVARAFTDDATPDADRPAADTLTAGLAPLPEVPGYAIEAEVGRGGMGVVYRAFEVALRRPVALKMLRHGLPEGAARFRAEAEFVAGLGHPNIVPVYAVGEVAGWPFLALEYLPGGSLADRLAGRPMAPSEVAELIVTLAGAVAHAHARNVIHRDLKPANVLLTADGTPKITDFGLAKHQILDVGLTATGIVLGTPSYMAPEQARGDGQTVGPAADVWALGAVLYECLTGRPPFKGANVPDTLRLVADADPVSPTALEPGVPRDLETICLKCLEKDPARRYPSAQALADDLARFRTGRPISARPVGSVGRVVRWAKRRPSAAGLAVAVVLLPAALALAGGLFLLSRESERGRVAAEDARDRLTVSEQATRAALAEATVARDELAEADTLFRVGLAYREWLRFRPASAAELLAGCPPDRRGWEWALVDRLGQAPGPARTDHAAAVWAVAVSADGRRVASGDRAGRIVVRTLAGDPVRVIEVGHPVWAVALTPDGAVLAAGCHDGTVRLFDAETGASRGELPHPNQAVNAVAFSPDGNTLATAGGDIGRDIILRPGPRPKDHNDVRLWDWKAGTKRVSWVGHPEAVLALAYSPDGKRLASGGRGLVAVWDVTTGKPVRVPRPGQWVRAVGFGADGAVVSAGLDPRADVWDAATGRHRGFLLHDAGVQAVATFADGRRAVTGSKDRSVRVWDLATLKPINALRGHIGDVTAVAAGPGGVLVSGGLDKQVRTWDADGQQGAVNFPTGARPDSLALDHAGRRAFVGTSGGTVQVWRVADGTRERVVRAGPSRVGTVAVRSDDKEAAAGGNDGTVAVFDPDTGDVSRRIQAGPGAVTGLAYLPNGRHLLTADGGDEVRVWDPATGKRVGGFPGRFKLGVAADGRTALTEVGGKLVLTDPAAGLAKATITPAAPAVRVGLSPGGDRVAVVESDRGVAVYDPGRLDRPLVVDRSFSGAVMKPVFGGDGRRLVLTGDDGLVRVIDADTGREGLLLSTDGLNVLALDLSAGGTVLAAALGDGTIRVWQTGMPPPVFRDAPGVVGVGFVGGVVVAKLADGRRAWDAATGEPAEVPAGDVPVAATAVSPDGRFRADAQIDRVRVVHLKCPAR